MRAPRIGRVSKIIAIKDAIIPRSFDRVVLITPTSDVIVRCDSRFDEVVISRSKKGKKRWRGRVLLSGDFRAVWTWIMVNQQGYRDGFRIELTDDKTVRVFDFIGICSGLDIREAMKTEANQPSQPTPPSRRG
jgi:hypothetical protein